MVYIGQRYRTRVKIPTLPNSGEGWGTLRFVLIKNGPFWGYLLFELVADFLSPGGGGMVMSHFATDPCDVS
jgi:hypothetical protein